MQRKRSWPNEVIKLSRYFHTGTDEDHENPVRLTEDTTARHRLQGIRYGVRSPASTRLYIFYKTSRPGVGPTQPPIQWEVAFFPSDRAIGA
jgi:hypothetical protein